jgi:hypothetical protein
MSDRVLLYLGGWAGENSIAGVDYLIIIEKLHVNSSKT